MTISKRFSLTTLSVWMGGALLFSQQPAQNPCGTFSPDQQWEQAFQKEIAQKFPNGASRQQPSVYTIPVIIHVIHGGQPVGTYPNLAQGQLLSQVKVLNDDFGGIGYNFGNYNGQAFANWAVNQSLTANSTDGLGRVKIANCMVQFCLATKDTNGNVLPEPGIDRINYVSKGWSNPYSMNSYASFKNLIDNTIKPQTIWNVSRYMNIWVTDENLQAAGGLLGYATFPPLTGLSGLPGSFGTANTDGFWCYAKAFGSVDQFPSGTYYSGNNRGRTSTHEIGHYLGLRHVWGDGTCATDYCADTPPASDKNFNAPNYPYKVNSCSGNAPDGEMFMNFMDYTNDDAKYMYTADQGLRVQTAMAASPFRKFLGTHNLCTVQQYSASSAFRAPVSVCGTSAAITLTNQSSGTPVPSFTWNVSGGALLSPGANSPYASVIFPSSGSYTVTLTANNGTMSTSQRVINVTVPSVTISGAQPYECEGKELVLSASGGIAFSWFPGAQQSPSINVTVAGIMTYTVNSYGAGNCNTSSVIMIEAQDCSGLAEWQSASSALQIAPNPAQNKIKIRHSTLGGTLSLKDVSGKTLLLREVQSGETSTEIQVAELLPGFYFVNWQGVEGQQSRVLIRE